MAETLITDSSAFNVEATKYGKPVINKEVEKTLKFLMLMVMHFHLTTHLC